MRNLIILKSYNTNNCIKDPPGRTYEMYEGREPTEARMGRAVLLYDMATLRIMCFYQHPLSQWG